MVKNRILDYAWLKSIPAPEKVSLERILVPTDFSECAHNALRYAIAIAIRSGASIKLMNAAHLPPQTGDTLISVGKDLQSKNKAALEDLYRQLRSELVEMGFGDLSIAIESDLGYAVDAVIRHEEADNSDLIVMGTKGASGIEGALIGSNASMVVKRAKCPVLIVPEGAEFSGFSKIVYAAERLEEDLPFLMDVAAFCALWDAELHILHLMDMEEDIKDAGKRFPESELAALKYPRIFLHILQSNEGTFEERLQAYLESRDAELVVMLMKERNLFQRIFNPSKTRKLAMHSKTPILAFHK